MLETFLAGILRKPFQLFRHILNDVSSIKKVLSLQCSFQSRKQVKTNWSQVMRVWSLLRCCSLLEIHDHNRPLCWSIVVREKPTVGAPFGGGGNFLVTASPRRRRMSLYIYIFSFTIYVMQQVL